jgi:hypothetical protein
VLFDKAPETMLGVDRLRERGNRLTVKIVGANDRAVKRQMIGNDYLQPDAPARDAGRSSGLEVGCARSTPDSCESGKTSLQTLEN